MRTQVTKFLMLCFIMYTNLEELPNEVSISQLVITIMHAFITIRLDYCNGLLYGLPKSQTVKLQRACVQNAAARLVLSLRKFSHISPQLCELHQLPIQYRIYFTSRIKSYPRYGLKYIVDEIYTQF